MSTCEDMENNVDNIVPVFRITLKFFLTVFLLIMNQTEFRLVQNQKENCHYDRIPFSLKGIRNRFL